jgi:hypothetical protein
MCRTLQQRAVYHLLSQTTKLCMAGSHIGTCFSCGLFPCPHRMIQGEQDIHQALRNVVSKHASFVTKDPPSWKALPRGPQKGLSINPNAGMDRAHREKKEQEEKGNITEMNRTPLALCGIGYLNPIWQPQLGS